jgi:hypothetical protein
MIFIHSFEAFDSNHLYWLCHYVIWSPEAGVPRCLSGPDWLDSPPGTPSLSWAVMLCLLAAYLFDFTFLHECLPVCLLSQKLNCTIYTATCGLQLYCLTFSVTHYWTLWLNCWHWGLWLGLRFNLKCGYKLPCHSFLKASAAIIPRIRSWMCPSQTFPIHYWLIILSFNAI